MFGAVHANMIGLLLSPNNWIIARMIGSVLLLIMLVASYLFVAKVMDFDNSESLIFATLTICPIGYLYFEFVIFSSFYVNYAYLSLLMIGVILMHVKSDNISRKKYLINYLIVICIGITMGMTGLKYAIFPVGPLVITSIIILWVYIHNNPEKIKEFNMR